MPKTGGPFKAQARKPNVKPRAGREILAALEVLESPPWLGPPKVKKLEGMRLDCLRVGDYRCVFETAGGVVIVLRVVGRKDLERILSRMS